MHIHGGQLCICMLHGPDRPRFALCFLQRQLPIAKPFQHLRDPASNWPTRTVRSCCRISASEPARRCLNSSCTTSRSVLHIATRPGALDNAVLLLHGTGGNAHSLMNPVFSDVLFGPGRLSISQKYFIILPDDIGHGESSKPSDGLHAHFPAYDYDDMVRSQRMMLDQMKIDHLRLILGTSMGCMQTFVWGETYPGFADALAPFACLPVQIAGRNRMMRYMGIQAIKQDPAWMDGEYKTSLCRACASRTTLIFIMGSARCVCRSSAHTRAGRAVRGQLLGARRCQPDANDMIYYLNASRNYDPSPRLESITDAVSVDQLGRRLHQSAGAGHR